MDLKQLPKFNAFGGSNSKVLNDITTPKYHSNYQSNLGSRINELFGSRKSRNAESNKDLANF